MNRRIVFFGLLCPFSKSVLPSLFLLLSLLQRVSRWREARSSSLWCTSHRKTSACPSTLHEQRYPSCSGICPSLLVRTAIFTQKAPVPPPIGLFCAGDVRCSFFLFRIVLFFVVILWFLFLGHANLVFFFTSLFFRCVLPALCGALDLANAPPLPNVRPGCMPPVVAELRTAVGSFDEIACAPFFHDAVHLARCSLFLCALPFSFVIQRAPCVVLFSPSPIPLKWLCVFITRPSHASPVRSFVLVSVISTRRLYLLLKQRTVRVK